MPVDTSTITSRVRGVLDAHGRLSGPAEDVAIDDDLYRQGLTSHASINVMLALEDEFDVEFPERLLRKTTFASIDAIVAALTELSPADAG